MSLAILLGNFLFEGSVLGFAGFELWKLRKERRKAKAAAVALEEAARHAEGQESADDRGAKPS